MNIGDKVRFLNDVGGGTVTAFRPGGIVLVEDEDGFDVPMPQNEVVVIEDETPKKKVLSPALSLDGEKGQGDRWTSSNKPNSSIHREGDVRKDREGLQPATLNGKEYLQSKTMIREDETEVDEQLEARMVRLEQTLQQQVQALQRLEEALQKAESRIALLEAENNLRKNERMMAHKAKPQPKPKPEKPKNIEDLQIL